MPSITPDSEAFDWSHSLPAEDAKYWRQEEIHRLNPTGEMSITALPHTNEGEATSWMAGVDLVTVKRQQRLIVRRILFYVLDVVMLLGVAVALMYALGALETVLGVN